ncbi:MAG: hypothetical protein AAF986_04185 [Pseudomonadota bacterium]
MARPYSEYRESDKGKLQTAFIQSNPEYWAKLLQQPDQIERVKELRELTDDLRWELEEKYQEGRQERIAEKAVDVWNERVKQLDYIAPHAAAHLMAETSILEEARQRVSAEHERNLQRLQDNEREAIEEITDQETASIHPPTKEEIATMSDQQKDTHFKAELHKLIDDANEARFQTSKLANSQRQALLEEAQKNGSQDPQGDVKTVINGMYKSVQDKLHGDVHALCVKYGYDADRKQVEFYADQSNAELDLEPQQNDYDQGVEPAQQQQQNSGFEQ